MIFYTLEHIFTHISFSLVSVVITIHLLTLFADAIVRLYDSSEKGIMAAFSCITGLLVTRWIYLKHLPLTNLYESLIFLSWSFSSIHMIPYFKKIKTYLNLNAITALSAIFTQGFATSGLLTEMNESKILVPALQSHWLMMHVSMMVLSYAALLCGSLVSLALLVITFQNFLRYFTKSKNLITEIFLLGMIDYIIEKENPLINTYCIFSRNYYRFRVIQQLDFWSYRIISIGFFFLTMGILSGAVWANEAWGSYWNWDPKETWAFITWTVFAIYLHIRTNKILESVNSAIMASLGFLIIWICYFGVNLFGIGLHSYGSFPVIYN
uniref:Cytochrome c biogenesis protein CcsA n=1 Tax=Pilea glauca (nom. nud.) TaxID=2789716 RepID=A0A7T0NCC1_9ROSA|nr:cytochrome c heme attachment protein [Pilea glauca (nom. nud.)]QPK42213.1 cytochrome c heme attachment protein [Pilea glauca (nom. nud.)]